MARGPTNETNLLNTNASNLQGNATSAEQTLLPTYSSMLSTGYATPQEAESAVNSGMGSVGSTFDTAAQEQQNEAARTNNPASLAASEDQLALEKGTALGDEANQLQAQKMKGQLAGAQGYQDLFKTNQDAADNMYGLGAHMFAPGQKGLSVGQGISNFFDALAGGVAKGASSGGAGG